MCGGGWTLGKGRGRGGRSGGSGVSELGLVERGSWRRVCFKGVSLSVRVGSCMGSVWGFWKGAWDGRRVKGVYGKKYERLMAVRIRR